MDKLSQSDPTQWFPMPAVLISSRARDGIPNIMGIGYVGFCCWDPPMLTLGVNLARYTRQILHDTGEVVVNVPYVDQVSTMDYCGFVSGKNNNKFASAGLTPLPASKVAAPLVGECPVNLECQVRQAIVLGSHELFVVEVVATHVDGCLVNGVATLSPVILQSRYYVAANQRLSPFGISAGNPPDHSGGIHS